ncbi:rab GTPase-binding effector protein 1 isoform X4 [Hydra vulgaris]|uniref:Rab GTPase-binding effector protein 1 isoform X4 n=1 Tax=Hydra vulgaris TaxID=6087 RepID=A0ABM4CMZ9_HYDVU
MDYKEKYEELLAEIEKSELEFGQKRAQFRQLYLDCENKLKDQKDITKQHEQKISELAKQLEKYKTENEGIQTAATLSLESYNEDLTALKKQHLEQLSSLQHLWEVSSQERINLITKQFEDDKNKLIQVNNKLEQRLKELKGDYQDESNKDGLISLMSNAFSRKSLETKSSSLEIKQHQAQADIDAWKSVVGPLEEENALLKKQLKELKEDNRNFPDRNNIENETFKEKLNDTKKYLDAERSARVDLEMYVAVLNTQKGVLQEDADKLRRELHNVCHLLEQEKSNHKELKETWTLANERFITTHNAMQKELELMREVLTSQQLEQISKSLRNNSSTFKPVTNSEKQKSIESLINFDKEKLSPQFLKRKSPAIASKVKADKEKNRNTNSPNLLLSDSDDDIEQAIIKQNLDRYNIEKAEEAFVMETPVINQSEKSLLGLKKSSSHGDIINVESSSQEYLQEKSLSQGDVSWIKNQDEESWSNQSKNRDEESWSMQDSTMTDETESKHTMIEKNWIEETSQLNQCMMCQNYEKQLQRLQAEFMIIKEKEERLEVDIEKLKTELESEREKFNSLKKSTENAAADTNSQISIYKTNQAEVDKQVQLLFTQFYQFQNEIIIEMKNLAEERDRCLAEMTSLKEHGENNKCSSHEDFIGNEEHLKSEIMLLKDRLMAEQFDRETTEKILEHSLDLANKKIATMAKNSALLQEEHSRSQDHSRPQDSAWLHDHESQ